MGTPNFSVPILKSLHQNGFLISSVYTQPPHKSQRGQKIKKSPIHEMAEILNIECRTPELLKNNQKEFDYLKKLNPDIVIVAAYGQLIQKKFLELSKNGFINIHTSILPKWRGAAPIQRSIMNLDKETGISIMRITEKLDTGPVCNIYKIDIHQNENSEEISKKLSLLASKKIPFEIKNILEGKAYFIEQNHNKSTYAKKIKKSEGLIDWKESAEKIIGKINGLFPFPGAFFNFNNERYKILKAEIGSGEGQTGQVINKDFEIACGTKQSIRIIQIQRQGKKPQKINEFMLGSQIKKGSKISNV